MAAHATGRPIIEVNTDTTILADTLRGDPLARLETDILPAFLVSRSWYAARDAGPPPVKVVEALPFGADGTPYLLLILQAEPPGRDAQRYFLPLAVSWDGAVDAGHRDALTILRRGGTEGVLFDAMADDGFVRTLFQGFGTGEAVSGLRFRHAVGHGTGGWWQQGLPIRRLGGEASNSLLRLGDTAFLKVFRKLEAAGSPEVEMVRFLTEDARFDRVPPLLGWIEREDASGAPISLAMVQGLVLPNDGDGWTYVTGHLEARLRDFESGDRE
ncbi:MAG TPA: 4-alpha-glucanotransferase, partial [Azospirillaceae bacterium]|nr:4-alpha-glucanotransferase [Azospirillaceae bacterium]